MRGICFIEPLFKATVSELKTVTRRMNDRYKVGEILYLKEPYRIETDKVVRYKYTSIHPDREKWSNKMYMPEKAARYYIEIISKRNERLQEITEEDCIREGIEKIGFGFFCNGLIYHSGEHKGKKRIFTSAVSAYRDLINTINGIETWNNNPVVTRYEYVIKYL